jgi:hypothetical protein
VNHSCRPNVLHILDADARIHCYALRPISAGDEVLIAYAPFCVTRELWERQKLLKPSLGTGCRCALCKEELRQMIALQRPLSQEEDLYRFHLQQGLKSGGVDPAGFVSSTVRYSETQTNSGRIDEAVSAFRGALTSRVPFDSTGTTARCSRLSTCL